MRMLCLPRVSPALTTCNCSSVYSYLQPRRTLLLGMSSQMEYAETNAELAELRSQEGLDVQLARDGLAIDVCL